MIYSLIPGNLTLIIGGAAAFLLTIFLMKKLAGVLPSDQGRAFAVEGALSKGKVRGAGIIFVLVFALCSLLFGKINVERVIYLVIICLCMLTGYFDDAAEKPWNEYLKGALDLILAIAVAVNYLYFNGNGFKIALLGGESVILPYWLYGLLIVALVWTAINVTNCTDGVDGLSATLTIITLGSFYFLSRIRLGDFDAYNYGIALFMIVLIAYLWYNANPSSMLMGDAGSRAMGMMIAITALLSHTPLLYIPFSILMILDGGLGLVKVALLRFLKIKILVNTRCPLHDDARKNKGWSNTQVVFRFAILQLMVSILFVWLVMAAAK